MVVIIKSTCITGNTSKLMDDEKNPLTDANTNGNLIYNGGSISTQ